MCADHVIDRFALPALYNVAFLLCVVYFVYAVAGMALWGKLQVSTYLDDHANFRSFASAIVVLFMATVGENWNGFMRDCMVQPPFCSGADCGNAGQVCIISYRCKHHSDANADSIGGRILGVI